MDSHEIEGEALSLFRLAGIDPASAPSPAQLANALPGVEVEYVLRASRPASIRCYGDRATIRILASASTTARAWFTAHELGELVVHRRRIRHEAIEQYADAIGAAIIAPRAAVRAVRDRCGDDLARTARALRVTETIAALRWGEVLGIGVAIVEPGRVKARGYMPPEQELRRIARAGGGDGLRVVRLTDAPRRVALVDHG